MVIASLLNHTQIASIYTPPTLHAILITVLLLLHTSPLVLPSFLFSSSFFLLLSSFFLLFFSGLVEFEVCCTLTAPAFLTAVYGSRLAQVLVSVSRWFRFGFGLAVMVCPRQHLVVFGSSRLQMMDELLVSAALFRHVCSSKLSVGFGFGWPRWFLLHVDNVMLLTSSCMALVSGLVWLGSSVAAFGFFIHGIAQLEGVDACDGCSRRRTALLPVRIDATGSWTFMASVLGRSRFGWHGLFLMSCSRCEVFELLVLDKGMDEIMFG